MNKAEFKKEHETLKRKHSIPQGEKLEKMLETEEGRKRYEDRSKRWDAFKKKWNIVFMIGDKPVFKKEKKGK